MVGKFFQEFFMVLIRGEGGCLLVLFMRGCFERNGSAQNGSKRSSKRESYPYLCGTVNLFHFYRVYAIWKVRGKASISRQVRESQGTFLESGKVREGKGKF